MHKQVSLVVVHTRLHFIFVVDISALRSLAEAAIIVGREIIIFISQYIPPKMSNRAYKLAFQFAY